jgi:predicted HicB family RNase H-like nuclease
MPTFSTPDRMGLMVSKDLHQRLKDQAKKEGRMLQDLVERLLVAALKNRKAA